MIRMYNILGLSPSFALRMWAKWCGVRDRAPVVAPKALLQISGVAYVLVTLKPDKWHFVFLWFLLGALPPNPWSFSGIGTSGESLKEAVFSRHRPGFRPFVHPAIP